MPKVKLSTKAKAAKLDKEILKSARITSKQVIGTKCLYCFLDLMEDLVNDLNSRPISDLLSNDCKIHRVMTWLKGISQD